MARDTIADQFDDGHFGYGALLEPDRVDDLVTQHNEHAAALDTIEATLDSLTGSPPTVSGTVITSTAGTALRSLLDALEALGLIVDTSTDA